MPAFLHHPAPSGNSYVSFVNSCALCSFLQIEAGCYVYASLTPARENVPILTKLLTYFVRGKAVAALKAVHTSQAASHSVGSLQEKGRVIQSGLFFFFIFFFWRLSKDGNSCAGEHRTVQARDTFDITPQIVGQARDFTRSDIFSWQSNLQLCWLK